ncbi:hypothetical protein [Dactylosporangium sp. CA-092794]|uniref:hypothetical protein n=1 Tax=Dactylosporangium sp. CA-092794 TaxID=3239929 RepID=UPI003D8C15DC
MLYVAFDQTGRCLVSRDDPATGRRAERADYNGLVAIVLTGSPEEGWADAAPDLDSARLLTGSVMVVVAGATLAASALLNPLLVVPAGAVVGVYVGRRYTAAAAELERRWAERHRVLATRAEVARFRRAFDAARTILVAWPFLADLVQVSSPAAEVTASLWTLSGLLVDHAELGEQAAGLSDARFGALPRETPVRAALDDRLTRVDASQRALSEEIDRRVAALTELAEHCAGFLRTETALHAAHEAVRRADESLRRVAPPEHAAPDDTRDLSERTAAIIAAYRALTGTDVTR